MKASVPQADPRDRLKREISLNGATMLVVGSVIGSGIFLTPGHVAELLPHPGIFLTAWLVGGLLSLAGAIANAELGAMYPRAGGDYVYLREAFHPAAGFLAGWFTFFTIFTGTVATLSVALAESVAGLIPLSDPAKLVLAIAFIVLTSAINYLAVRWGTRVNSITSYIKIAVLIVFCVAGPILGKGVLEPIDATFDQVAAWPISGFALALSPILFTYLGWNAPVYVASEIRCPNRNLPRALFLGLLICTCLYLVVNVVYLYAIPLERLRGEPNVGKLAAMTLFGPIAGTLIASFVFLSILGTLNATILVGPRIAYAMALDGLFFGGAERVHQRFHTPHRAIVIQGLVAVAIVIALQDFTKALDYTVFGILLATIADTLALYALRLRKPELPRPYRAWGYPLLPALYLLATSVIALIMLQERPGECALGLLLLAMGVPFYLCFARKPGTSSFRRS